MPSTYSHQRVRSFARPGLYARVNGTNQTASAAISIITTTTAQTNAVCVAARIQPSERAATSRDIEAMGGSTHAIKTARTADRVATAREGALTRKIHAAGRSAGTKNAARRPT